MELCVYVCARVSVCLCARVCEGHWLTVHKRQEVCLRGWPRPSLPGSTQPRQRTRAACCWNQTAALRTSASRCGSQIVERAAERSEFTTHVVGVRIQVSLNNKAEHSLTEDVWPRHVYDVVFRLPLLEMWWRIFAFHTGRIPRFPTPVSAGTASSTADGDKKCSQSCLLNANC